MCCVSFFLSLAFCCVTPQTQRIDERINSLCGFCFRLDFFLLPKVTFSPFFLCCVPRNVFAQRFRTIRTCCLLCYRSFQYRNAPKVSLLNKTAQQNPAECTLDVHSEGAHLECGKCCAVFVLREKKCVFFCCLFFCCILCFLIFIFFGVFFPSQSFWFLFGTLCCCFCFSSLLLSLSLSVSVCVCLCLSLFVFAPKLFGFSQNTNHKTHTAQHNVEKKKVLIFG